MFALLLLVALRMPSLAQPAGGDQLLYSYVGQRVLAGDVPYRDAFEQKPPGVFFVYAAAWRVWPRESVVAAIDLAAAALAAWLLVGLGRRMFGGRVGEAAAALFLLLGDPGIQRLGGMNVRAQCETFVALAVTAAVGLAWTSRQRPWRLLLAGALCGVAVWLKYNSVVYALPVTLAALTAEALPGSTPSRRRSIAWVAAGGVTILGLGLACFAAAGALTDLWLGTVSYNLAYSGETYRSASHAVQYVVTLPLERARVDGLWYLGGVGALCLIGSAHKAARPRLVTLAWLVAVVLSIAINGARGLPQYFVQAVPALALTASAGLAIAWRERRWWGLRGRPVREAAAVLLVVGMWRVGIEPTPAWRPRLFGVPQALANDAFDLRYATGTIDRETYLRRFGRDDAGKFSPLAVERLAQRVRDTTATDESVYVFGFASGGVYVKSGRRSASRFFWSRPVVLEFPRGRPGFGSSGLVADLERARPAIVALQKRDWGLAEPDVPDSLAFFMATSSLREWLEAGYEPDYEDAAFVVWRRKH